MTNLINRLTRATEADGTIDLTDLFFGSSCKTLRDALHDLFVVKDDILAMQPSSVADRDLVIHATAYYLESTRQPPFIIGDDDNLNRQAAQIIKEMQEEIAIEDEEKSAMEDDDDLNVDDEEIEYDDYLRMSEDGEIVYAEEI